MKFIYSHSVRVLFLPVLAALGVWLPAAPAGAAVVTSTADSGAGSLRAAIAAASANSAITFTNSLSGQTIYLTSGELLISKNLILDASSLANGLLIDAGQNSRVLEVSNVFVTLNALTLTNGNVAAGNGGGILADSGANLALFRCTVAGNSANFGGGLYGVSATLNVSNCVFSANAANYGGGIFNDTGCTLTLILSTLTGNSAIQNGGGEGGAILNHGAVSLIDCTLSGNFTSSGGGGGGLYNVLGTSTLNNCTLAGNSATNGVGGGVYVLNGEVTMNNSTCAGNAAPGGDAGGIYNGAATYLTNTIVAGNSALTDSNIAGAFTGVDNLTEGDPGLAPLGNYGGLTQTMLPLPGSPALGAGTTAVTSFLGADQRGDARSYNGTVDIGSVEARRSIVLNTNDSGAGSLRNALAGAADLVTFTNTLAGQTILLTSGELLIASSLAVDASALAAGITVSGGGVYRVLEITNAYLNLNSLALVHGYEALGNGGGILADSGANLVLLNCTVANNWANYGGGLFGISATLDVSNCVFSANAANYGGGIFNDTGCTLNCILSTLAGNSAIQNGGGEGGGILNDGAVTLSDSTLSGNFTSSGGGGGGLYNVMGTNTLNNCTVAGNSATNGVGGGVYVLNGEVTMNNSTCAGNAAPGGDAGGIYNGAATYLTNTIVAGNSALTDSNIAGAFTGVDNLTEGDPGLAPLGNYGGLTQTMLPLPGSPALGAGTTAVTSFLGADQRGDARSYNGTVDIGSVEARRSIVLNTNDSGAGSLRNALAGAADLVTFTNTLAGQTILLTSGELLIASSLAVDASALAGGINVSGGGAYRVLEITNAYVTLNSLALVSGYALYNGGGMLVDANVALSLSNCTFSANVSSSYGGGICENPGDTITMNNCAFTANSAAYGGGVVAFGGVLMANRSTFSGNVAGPGSGYGGAILTYTNFLTLNNCTLAGNSATGSFSKAGALFSNPGGINNLNNCTLSGNSAAYGGAIYSQFDESVLDLTNTIVAGNSAATSNPNIYGTISGVNNLTDGNPELAPLGNYGGPTQTMPPLAGSPALGAGAAAVTNFLATDQRGFPRSYGGSVDIGAVEVQRNLVLNNNDSGPGSLRNAVGFDYIGIVNFTNTLSGQTILLTSGALALNNYVTIDATALPAGIQINGNASSSVFNVQNGAVATLAGLTLVNGNGGGTGGGAIVNQGTLTLNQMTLAGNNSVAYGGAILNEGTLTANQSTFSGNYSVTYGGAIENGGPLVLNNSTFAGNTGNGGGAIDNNAPLLAVQCTFYGNTTSGGPGSAIWAGGSNVVLQCTLVSNRNDVAISQYLGAPITISNSIVALSPYGNIGGSFSGSYNFTNGDPLLAPLGFYGGPTQTMPPAFGSPVLNAGADSITNLLTTDQRGYPRLSGAHVDIGAVEAQLAAASPQPILTNPLWSGTGASRTFQFTFTNAPDVDFTALTTTNLTLPRSAWTVLGNADQTAPGRYEFADSGATNYPQRFYQIVSP